jgi:hypothetical protein
MTDLPEPNERAEPVATDSPTVENPSAADIMLRVVERVMVEMAYAPPKSGEIVH